MITSWFPLFRGKKGFMLVHLLFSGM